MHPNPEDVKVVRADQLKVGTLVYSANGWLNGPEETNGCWRRIIEINPDVKSERDLCVVLEQFPDEPRSLVEWFDNHTLVMVHK